MLSKIITTLIVVVIAYMFYKNNTVPSYIGVEEGKLAPMPSTPNAVSSQTDDSEKRVESISFDDADKAKKRVMAVLNKMTGNEVITDEGDYMHVVFTTPTMKFHDDVELYFDTENGVLHYRSQSRTGYSDKGLNRARYNEFVSLYQQQ